MKQGYVLMALCVFVALFSSAYGQCILDGAESVAFDSLRNRYIVSSLNQKALVQIDLEGNYSCYKTNLPGCFGNCIKNDTLFVGTGKGLFAIDLATDSMIFSIALPAQQNADGVTTDTSGYVYVVDTGGRIFKVRISDQQYWIFADSGLATSTQDVFFDARHNRLLLAGYSANAPVQAVDLDDSTVYNLVVTPTGYFDGITMDDLGNVFLGSHVDGQVIKYDSTFTNPPEIVTSGIPEPAGLDYNVRDDIIAVPSFSGDKVYFVSYYLDFSADTTLGWIPFEANFEGTSRLTVDTWNWDFGDGGTSDIQSPAHIYQDRGIYDVTLNVTSGGESYSYTQRKFIVVLADTLWASSATGDPGASIEVDVYGSNTIPLTMIRIPVEYAGVLSLTLDSFSTVGCRTENMDNAIMSSYDAVNKRAFFSISNDAEGTTDPMPPGSGMIMKLFFTISPSATFGQTAPVVLDGYSTRLPQFSGAAVYLYQPLSFPGTISINGLCGDANGSGGVNILDVTFLLNYLYRGGPAPDPESIADVNGTGNLNILDVTYLIAYLYKGGPEPQCI
ncbi:MAG: PKD domain-containing protein [Candidatus Zixiibacteriota bacterium]